MIAQFSAAGSAGRRRRRWRVATLPVLRRGSDRFARQAGRPSAFRICLWVVTEEIDQAAGPVGAEPSPEPAPEETAAEPAQQEPMPPIESRFLYVGVASKRAKQLRRGAVPRVKGLAPNPETGESPGPRGKLERVAMREVDDGLIVYELPDPKPAGGDGA